VLLPPDIEASWSMYLMEELEPSLVASEPRRLRSLALDVLLVGDRIVLVSEDLLFPVDSDAMDTTLRDDRVKGLWKQFENIVICRRYKTLLDEVNIETTEQQSE